MKDDTVHHYVETFYAHFDKQITDEMYAAMEEQGMTLPEVVTLASFVQEEAGNDQDDNVAQVFRNRLAEGSPYPKLQSNTSSHVQSDADNNYLWNWVAPYYGGWDSIPKKTDDLQHPPLPRSSCRPHLQPRHRGHPRRPRPPAQRGGEGRLFLRHRPQGNILLRPHLRRPSEKLRCGGKSQ